ncbi:MAG: beta-ketoacyl synthase chain length factor, partial [Myxococcaceae bacterium]
MRAAIHGLGTADAPRTDPDPRVNRLPRLDRMAFAAVREALGGRALPDSLALVFGTGYGALAATEAFLQSVASRGMAYGSATAFHQSVHHSPAGQLSLLLGIRGPVLTVSQREISGEAALRVGLTLLDRFEFVLVVAADEKTAVLEA